MGRRGKDRYKKLEHGLQHMRPKVSRAGHKEFLACTAGLKRKFPISRNSTAII